MKIGISVEILQEVLYHLQTKPFSEVNDLIGRLVEEVNSNPDGPKIQTIKPNKEEVK